MSGTRGLYCNTCNQHIARCECGESFSTAQRQGAVEPAVNLPAAPAPTEQAGELPPLPERKLFVETMKEVFGEDENFDRDDNGRYINRAWQDAYVGWIHRAALAARQAPTKAAKEAPAPAGRDLKVGDTVKVLDGCIAVGEDFSGRVGVIEGFDCDDMSGVSVQFPDGEGLFCTREDLALESGAAQQVGPAPSIAQGAGSIDTPEFRKLAFAYAKAIMHGSVPESSAAWGALVTHIDSGSIARTAAPSDEILRNWIALAHDNERSMGDRLQCLICTFSAMLKGEKPGLYKIREQVDYEEVQADHNRLVRMLDVAWNGEAGAAKQASLCDIVSQIVRELAAAPSEGRAVATKWAIYYDNLGEQPYTSQFMTGWHLYDHKEDAEREIAHYTFAKHYTPKEVCIYTHPAAPATEQAPEAQAKRRSLLRAPISATNPLPPGCYCPPDQCQAPRIMGTQTPCRRVLATPATEQAAPTGIATGYTGGCMTSDAELGGIITLHYASAAEAEAAFVALTDMLAEPAQTKESGEGAGS
jgi:hypothetical protein